MFINSALKSTENMLKKTFETGISEEEYYVLLFLLYDYMSDENLAIVMENLTKKSKWVIENDIAVSINKDFSPEPRRSAASSAGRSTAFSAERPARSRTASSNRSVIR